MKEKDKLSPMALQDQQAGKLLFTLLEDYSQYRWYNNQTLDNCFQSCLIWFFMVGLNLNLN